MLLLTGVEFALRVTARIPVGNDGAWPYDSLNMKLSRMTGSLILAAGLAGGVFAVPAQADNSTSVDDFLKSLDKL